MKILGAFPYLFLSFVLLSNRRLLNVRNDHVIEGFYFNVKITAQKGDKMLLIAERFAVGQLVSLLLITTTATVVFSYSLKSIHITNQTG